MEKEIKRLFTCSGEECDFHLNEGEEEYLPEYMDSQYNLWCPCCHSKMTKVKNPNLAIMFDLKDIFDERS